MSSRLRKLPLAVLAAARGARARRLRRLAHGVTTGTYAGESGNERPLPERRPARSTRSSSRASSTPPTSKTPPTCRGSRPPSASSNPARSGSRCSCRSTTTRSVPLPAATNLTITDTQNNIYTPIVPDADQRIRLPRRPGAGQGPAPAAGVGRRLGRHPGRAAALQDPGRLARQPSARAEDRRLRTTPPRRPRPSSTSRRRRCALASVHAPLSGRPAVRLRAPDGRRAPRSLRRRRL